MRKISALCFFGQDKKKVQLINDVALGGLRSTDYYGQSAPPVPAASQACLPVGKAGWILGSCLVTGMGAGFLPNAFSLIRGLRAAVFAYFRRFDLPNRCSGFLTNMGSMSYGSPGILDRVCQSVFDHVSPSPITG